MELFIMDDNVGDTHITFEQQQQAVYIKIYNCAQHIYIKRAILALLD